MSHVDDGRLHAHLDGALSPEERVAVEAHLAECADCRADLERARRFRARARQLLALAAPDAVEPPPFDAIRARAEARRAAAPAAARSPAATNADRGPATSLDAGAAPHRRLPRGLAWAAVAVLALGLAGLARTLVRAPSPEPRLASAADE
ncbi:MAG: zf-HC2 domain-containing protein, partial [Gemmatimonadetes bacterium]|nr:zf-HC2 domain-containing protein [Gemmatimonadota bacterium]